MKQFDLNAIMADMHQTFPVAQHRPIIGITGNYGELTCKLGEGYYKQVVAAGGVPVVIPPVADAAVLANTLDRIDAPTSTRSIKARNQYPDWGASTASATCPSC